MRQFCTFFIAFGLFSNLFAQNAPLNPWVSVAPDAVALPPGAERLFEPKAYTAFTLDYDAMVAQLAKAPMEFTYEAGQKPCTVQIPQADGTLETFAMVYTQVMAPGLAARYPEIRTYSGESLNTPNKQVRITTGPYHGLHMFITRPDKGVEYVEPIAKGQNLYYMAYDRHSYPTEIETKGQVIATERAPDLPGTYPEPRYTPGAPAPQDRGTLLNPVVLKIYKFACATTGEFSQDNGGTTASVLAKVTATTNELNAIYERDLAVRLQLIEEEDQILYLDPATDPYTGTTVGGWLDQNPVAMLMQLGNNDKYDIGHVLARYLGGSAVGVGWLNSVCTDFKGRGCSAGNIPYGDYFFGVVGQEIGHQWNGLHTWNHCGGTTEPFPNYERCEPGSGSTIMSYAGACGSPDDVQGSADLYYHVCSIFGIRNFIENGNGKLCGQNVTTGNNPPVAVIPYPDNFFIPIGTPFELTGTATDADGDAVTYNWDEVDLGPLVPMDAPQGSSPIFRSFPPTSNPIRIFPRLQSIIFNTGNDSEKLPTYSRDLTFCLIARDDKPGGGGVGIDTLAFRATDQAGPFRVTYPNSSSDTWYVGEYQTITWDVANTDKAPVNCKTVNIRLSINNGLVNQVLLASGVPNNGKCCVLVPNNLSNIARIRIEAADNIFFDISNAGFNIKAPTQPDFSICPGVFSDYACAPTVYSTEIGTSASAGFSEPITLEATGLPTGATATFSPNPVTPGSASTLTLDFSGTTPEGLFDLTVSATANGNTKTSSLAFTVVQNDFSALALQSPADGAQSVDIAPWLYWNGIADAQKYEIQVASSPSFEAATILASNANVTPDSFKVPVLLEDGQVCYWRVRPKNECGEGAWTDPFVFVTKVQNCASLAATDLPKNISSGGAVTVESKITVSGAGILSDVNITKVQGSHTFMSELDVRVISPAGTEVTLFKNKCAGYSGTFNIGFDDSANGSFACPPPQNGSFAKPNQPLSAFNGQNANGEWTLRVKDNTVGSGGQLAGFELEFCSSVALSAPFIVNNNTLQVVPGNNAGIGQDLLKVDDPNNTAGQLLFTLITVPQHGDLRIGGTPLKPGDQFTQDDINNGALRYYDYGSAAGTDEFRFSVTDGEGGLVSGTFHIQQFPVGTKDILNNIAFDLAPNPTGESVRLFVSQPLEADTRVQIYNVAGQLLHTWTLAAGATTLLLDVADLPDGVYAISIENEKGSGVRKLVVR